MTALAVERAPCGGPTVSNPAPNAPQHDAVALTDGGQRAVIRLGDQHYLLRITRQGKLLLTK
ncbi:MAG: hemin uptake protein HemP [Paracoccaceae bacterium]